MLNDDHHTLGATSAANVVYHEGPSEATRHSADPTASAPRDDDRAAQHFRESTGIEEKTCTYAVWLFLCQVYALCWKQYLIKRRRPLSTLFEIVAPALTLLILVYGTKLSPVVPIPAFVYDSVPVIATNATMSATVDPATQQFMQLLEAAHLYQQNDPQSYFQTVFLPLLSSTNASLASQLSSLMLANSAAADPFIVPNFDSFLSMMLAARAAIGRTGMKSYQNLDATIWHVMNLGLVAFTPNTTAVTAMIQYFSTTSAAFSSMVLCPSSTPASCTGFDSEQAVSDEIARRGGSQFLWAIVEVNTLDPATHVFDYTIRMNQSFVPETSSVIDKFPQGLGQSYGKYIYSGFVTLQFELNEYFRRLCVAHDVSALVLPPPEIGFGVIPLFESMCNIAVGTPNLFASSQSPLDNMIIGSLLQNPTTRQVLVIPAPVPNVYLPCNAGIVGYCSNASSFASVGELKQCLAAANQTYAGSMCGEAVHYFETCEATLNVACGMTFTDFFYGQPNKLQNVSCMAAAMQCNPTSTFATTIRTTALLYGGSICATDANAMCSIPPSSNNCKSNANACQPEYSCLRRKLDEGATFSVPMCKALVEMIPRCFDDFATICPFSPSTSSVESAPFECMQSQQSFLSQTCWSSTFVQTYLETIFGSAAIVTTIPTATSYCRTAHQVAMAFTDGISVGAFPARAYGQNQFYANGGALMGLVVALAYMYPFVAHVRLIVQERAKRQRLFLMLIGVHHSAILVTYTLIGLLTVFLSSIVSTIVLSGVFPGVSTDNLFSLVFTYGFSLVGLASLLASFFSSTRHSGAIAPFFLFLLAIPSFVVVGNVDFVTSLLSPSVAILATDLFVGYSQSSATPEVFQADLSKATSLLFGLALLYLVLALAVEQYRVLSTSIGVVGDAARVVSQRFFGAYRYAMSPFRKTGVYRRLQQGVGNSAATATGGNDEELEAVVDDHANMLQDEEEALNEGGGGGFGYEEFSSDGDGGHRPVAFEIGGVNQNGTRSSLAPSETNPHATAAEGPGGRRSRSFSQVRSKAWKVCIAMSRLGLTLFESSRTVVALKNVSGFLYQHRVNCIIGGTGSGKSALVRLLMGEISPDSGSFTMDGEPPTKFNRQDLGVCLQQDVCWDQLTTAEHIELVQLVKGCIHLADMKAEAETLLSVLDLQEKRDCHADTLSYGMLRKLNVAMSFAGGSRLVVLDEPTASIDPLSRKSVWHLLRSNVASRCIIVSTSYLEELDDAHHLILLEDGAVRCSGTPLYLKRSFGSGFVLSVSRGQHLRAASVLEAVARRIARAQLINNVGQELCFRIADEDLPLAGPLLQDLEAMPGVSSVALSDHRLDEIFMRVTREQGISEALMSQLTHGGTSFGTEAALNDHGAVAEQRSDRTSHSAAYQQLSSTESQRGSINSTNAATANTTNMDDDDDGAPVTSSPADNVHFVGTTAEKSTRLPSGSYANFHQCFSAVLMKRFSTGVATLLSSLFQFLLPLVCISLAINLLDVPVPSQPSLTLDPSSLYGSNDVLFSTDQVINKTLLEKALLFAATGDSTHYMPVAANSSVAMSLLLQSQMDAHDVARYGSLVFNDTFIEFWIDNYVIWNATSNAAFFVSRNQTLWKTDTILHNTSSPHALSAYLNQLANIRLYKSVQRYSGSIQSRNYPLPYQSRVITTGSLIVNIISSILLLVPFTFFPAQFVAVIVKERERGMLDAEFASQLSPLAYWVANFTWNMLVFALFSAFSILLYVNSENTLIWGFSEAMYTWFVLLLYGACVTTISYIISAFFKKHTTAQNAVTMFHFAFGFVLVVAANAIDLLPDNATTADAKSTNNGLMQLFRFLPTYALGESFIKLSKLPYESILHPGQEQSVQDLLAPSIKLMLLFPLYLGGLILHQSMGRVELRNWWKTHVKAPLRRFFNARRNPWEEDGLLMVDDDPTVAAERARSLTASGLNATDLWRRYDKTGHEVVAVQNVAFHLGRERLLLVGPNGCGKSTLLRCLAGAEPPSAGRVVNRGRSMTEHTTEYWAARSTMGYAGDTPSHNEPVPPYLLLHMMADFRGLRRSRKREQHIKLLMSTMGIWAYRFQSCKNLSPAIRRRVAVAMSLVGFPDTIILDEPTTSLDPVGRRQLWASLQAAPLSSSILMSSQWSEDVDMLASRVMLMDNGKIKQIGPVDELRNMARQSGYVVTIYWKQVPQNVAVHQHSAERRAQQKEDMIQFFATTWPLCVVVEENQALIRFRIPATDEAVMSSESGADRSVDVWGRSAESTAAPESQASTVSTATTRQLPASLMDGFADPQPSLLAAASASHPPRRTIHTAASILEQLLAKRREWSTHPLWASAPPSPRDDAISPLSAPTNMNEMADIIGVPGPASSTPAAPPAGSSLPFEFDVSKATFAMLLDAALGNKCTTVQHISRMLNLPSNVKLRRDHEGH